MIDINNIPDPILITGCARSGTSMVAGAVYMCGAFGGRMRGPNRYNERGMFENKRIVDNLIKPYLRSINCDPLGQYPIPHTDRLPIPRDLRQKIINIMLEEGYQGGPWFYKGAKMCLIWPVLHYAFPNAKWIIVRRRTGDIVNSCLHTTFMRAFHIKDNIVRIGVKTEADGWLWWVRQHEKRFIEMINYGLNVKVVWPHRMITADYQQLYETMEWCGLKWDVNKVLSFVDPKLWHPRVRNAPVTPASPLKVEEEENGTESDGQGSEGDNRDGADGSQDVAVHNSSECDSDGHTGERHDSDDGSDEGDRTVVGSSFPSV